LIDWWPVAAAAACAGILMPLGIRARSIGVDEAVGARKLHLVPTSRLGGAMVVLACLFASMVVPLAGQTGLSESLPLALAALPVVLAGLFEDVTRRVRPRYRMLAAVAAAVLASALSGGIIPRVDLPPVDAVLPHLWLALPLTWFMVAGACNAFNLIDGANGLACGTALIMFGGIAAAAGWSGDAQTMNEALMVMGALAGFLVWNYPRGRIFLGDAGAYFIGFMYAELAIRLVARNSEISAWYVIVLAAYPIVETLFSIYRRKIFHRTPSMSSDALHLHSLIYRRLTLPAELRRPDGDRSRANAQVAPYLWLHVALCFTVAVAFHDNAPALWTGLAVYVAFYVNRYRALVRFGGRRAWARSMAVERGPEAVERPDAP
jgi:UDP-N-acetylmuramyl pentapeptide phosphotransferase/UDP-N-acetylglucosamine-1-phosphate transferase